MTLDCPFCKETDWKNVINLARHLEKEHVYKTCLTLAKKKEEELEI